LSIPSSDGPEGRTHYDGPLVFLIIEFFCTFGTFTDRFSFSWVKSHKALDMVPPTLSTPNELATIKALHRTRIFVADPDKGIAMIMPA